MSEQKPPPRRQRSWLERIVLGVGLLLIIGVLAAIGLYLAMSKGLPSIDWARHYRPPIVTEVWSGDEQLIGEYSVERRKVVPYERIPKKLVQALIASEDADFFDHQGVSITGIVRAFVKTFILRKHMQGGSTLSQQTAKAILASVEGVKAAHVRSGWAGKRRYLRELILTSRLERNFNKEQILNLYLNEVYLGHHSYGVQAAAENYFRKNVWELTLPEMALIAGLPQAPSSFSPFSHPEAARSRRSYVLRRMLEEGMISQQEHDAADTAAIQVFPVPDISRETAPYVSEHVRRDLVARYSNDRLLKDGLKVYTTVDLEREVDASAATLRGVLEADKRQGFRGPLTHLAEKDWPDFVAKESAFLKAPPPEGGKGQEVIAALVTSLERDGAVARVTVGPDKGHIPISHATWARKPNSEQNAEYVHVSSFKGVLVPGDVVLVREVPGKSDKSRSDKSGRGKRNRRSRRDKGSKSSVTKSGVSKSSGSGASKPVVAPGAPSAADVAKSEPVEEDKVGEHEEETDRIYSLEQDPKLQGALISLDPNSGYVQAMIGGYDFEKSEFNRAFQACRQPGSAFKPVIYSAAIEQRGFTASTILLDAPLVTDDESTGKRWKPNNYEETFAGEVPVRKALLHSMNTPAIRTLQQVGVKAAAQWAHKLGITTKINEDLSMALGSSCVYLWDLTQAYALFDRMGKRPKPIFLRRVLDRDGRILEDHSSYYDSWTTIEDRIAAGYAKLFETPEQVIAPETAFLITDLMESVCRPPGTGGHAVALGKPVAGKTGTTNDLFDAWFVGYTRDLVTGVWVGYDDYDTPMDKYETGGHTALPIWLEYMQHSLKGVPQGAFEPPSDKIVYASIDPETGRRVPPETRGSVREAYLLGNEPQLPGTPGAGPTATPSETGDAVTRGGL